MEYELYSYCTGMGVFVILLILAYHFIGEDNQVKHVQNENNQAA